MSNARFEIERYEELEMTEYRFTEGSTKRTFKLYDVPLDTYDECMKRLSDLRKRVADKYKKKEPSIEELLRYVLREFAAESADVWNLLFRLEGADVVDAAWLRRTLTVPRLKRIWRQAIKDNGWESVAAIVEEKLFPFLLDLAQARAAAAAAAMPLEVDGSRAPSSTTS